MRFVLLGLALTLSALPAKAEAVTVREIVELTRAGLPDEVLTALIDADRTIFVLDVDQILELRRAGVSETVLLKMIRSRREFEPSAESAPPPPARVPEVVIIGSPPPPPVTIVVPQYYFVPVPIWGVRSPRVPAAPFLAPEHRGFGRFINH